MFHQSVCASTVVTQPLDCSVSSKPSVPRKQCSLELIQVLWHNLNVGEEVDSVLHLPIRKMNTSNETSAADLLCRGESSVVTQAIKLLLYVIVILVSLIGNTLVFAVVCKNRRMRTPVNFFVVNLSAADILITVFYMPRMISRIFLVMEWGLSGDLGHVLCKVAPFVEELSAFVSVLTLILMAVDRVFAVLFPLKHIVTNNVAYTSIVAVWLVASALRLPMFYGLHFTTGKDGRTFCHLEFDSKMASNLYVTFFILPLFVIVILYSAILVSLKKRKPIGVELSTIHCNYKNCLLRTRKVMNMLFAIVFVFAVGWCLHFFLPVLFFRFGTKVCRLVFPAFFLGHVTSAINPCIYLVYIENYRRGFRDILNLLYIAIRSSKSKVSPLHGSTVLRGGSKCNR